MILYLELIENITVVSPGACCNLEVVRTLNLRLVYKPMDLMLSVD